MTIFSDSILGRITNQTATALIDAKISEKLSDVVIELVQSGFKVVEESLNIAKDLTQPDEKEKKT